MLPAARLAARSLAAAAPAARALARPQALTRVAAIRAPVRALSAEPAAAAGAGAQPGSTGGFMANAPKHPDYEGFEAVFRYYLPTNTHLVMFVVAFYAAIITAAKANSNANKRAEAAKAPPPEYPDFHSK